MLRLIAPQHQQQLLFPPPSPSPSPSPLPSPPLPPPLSPLLHHQQLLQSHVERTEEENGGANNCKDPIVLTHVWIHNNSSKHDGSNEGRSKEKDSPSTPLFEQRITTIPSLASVIHTLAREIAQTWERFMDPSIPPKVALILPPSEAYLACMLSVLRANGSFVPIDEKSSPEKMRYMIDTAGICIVICKYGHVPIPLQLWFVAHVPSFSTSYPNTMILVNPNARKIMMETRKKMTLSFDTAYTVFTSGTTGAPKPVSVSHSCISSNIIDLCNIFHLHPDDTLFWGTSIAFDPSIVEIWMGLRSGAKLLTVSDDIRLAPSYLAKILVAHKVAILMMTPSQFSRFSFPDRKLLFSSAALRGIVLGGEAFPSISTIKLWRQEGYTGRLWNIYGTTEVSSWAMVHEVAESDLMENHPVPLGTPLSGTEIDVRDENNCSIFSGEGVLWIGGKDRLCLLGDELEPQIMRNTHDIIHIETNLKGPTIRWIGRTDHLVKRFGQRIQVDVLELQLKQFCHQIQSCRFVLLQNDDSNFGEKNKMFLFLQHSDPNLFHRSSLSYFSNYIWDIFHKNFATVEWPNRIFLLEALPLNENGKVDHMQLISLYRLFLANNCETLKELEPKMNESGPSFVLEEYTNNHQLASQFIASLCGSLNISNFKENDYFVTLGGDSIMATHLSRYWSHQIASIKMTHPNNADANLVEELYILFLNTILHYPIGHLLDMVRNDQLLKLISNGKMIANGKTTNSITTLGITEKLSKEDTKLKVSARGRQSVTSTNFHSSLENLKLSFQWSMDTGRCVDASPLIVKYTSVTLVFIGSHSHRFFAINALTGHIYWSRVFQDRIESSAVCSPCGQYIVVGSYDHKLYVLNAWNGEFHWVFDQATDVFKGPGEFLTLRSKNYFVAGNHDGKLYNLDIENKQLIWQVSLNGGIFAGIKTYETFQGIKLVIAATLRGELVAIQGDSGEVVWRLNMETPIFSTLYLEPSTKQIFVGGTNNTLHTISLDTGNIKWQFKTTGPIYSSPVSVFHDENQRVVFGCHDGRVYCLDGVKGTLLWNLHLGNEPVYSSPACVTVNPTYPELGDNEQRKRRKLWSTQASGFLAIANTSGNLFLISLENGQILHQCKLPGEVYSSPVVFEDRLWIGCRDDKLYCFQIL